MYINLILHASNLLHLKVIHLLNESGPLEFLASEVANGRIQEGITCHHYNWVCGEPQPHFDMYYIFGASIFFHKF